MSFRCFGEILLTADMSGAPRVYQKVTPTKRDFILKACRVWIIHYGDPAYTALTMKIYSDNGGAPKTLLATSSNSRTKAALSQVISSAHGAVETFFEFADFIMKKNETYHFVIFASGYTGTESSHLALKHSYPDPAYQTSVDMAYEGSLRSPHDLTLVGGAL